MAHKTQQIGDITPELAQEISGQTFETIVPVTSRELFWRAKYLLEAASLAHLPFMFWLVSTHRPRRTVALNIGNGVTYFAACQAIDKSGMDAMCQGFGAWDGKGVPSGLESYNAEQYEEFSILAEDIPAQAARKVQKESIDLLIVDAPLSRELIESVLTDWPPRMTDRGVIFMTGLDTLSNEDADRLQTWCEGKKSIRFSHNGGLLLIALDEAAGMPSGQLGQLDPNSTAFIAIERIFARLGASHLHEWKAQDQTVLARDLSETLRATEKSNDEAKKEAAAILKDKETLQRKLETLQEAYDAHQTNAVPSEAVLADVQAKTAHLEAELQTHKDNAARLVRERDELIARLTKAEEAAKAAQNVYTDQEQAVATLQNQLDVENRQRIAVSKELATLKRSYDTAQAQHNSELAQLKKALQIAEQAVISERDALQTAENMRDRLQEEFKENATSQEAELRTLTEALERESEQRIALSEELRAKERAQNEEAARHLEEIKTLTQALSDTEEQSILRNDAIKTAEAEHARMHAQLADVSSTLEIRTREAKALGAHTAELEKTLPQLHDTIAQKDMQLDDLQSRINALQTEVTQKETEAAQTQTALQNELNQLQGQSQDQLAQAQTRIDTLQAELAQTRLARDTEEARHAAVSKEVARLKEQAAATQAELDSAKAAFDKKLSAAQTKSRKQDKTISNLRLQLQQQEEHAQNLEKTYAELMDSTSWRVTAPLRQATSVIRGKK